LFNIVQIDSLSCYECSCKISEKCSCTETVFFNGTNTYCVITLSNLDGRIVLGHIDRSSPKKQIKNPHYVSVLESIIYDDLQKRWYSRNDMVNYGCNWDKCNDPKLIQSLPHTFSLNLDSSWLNNNILEKSDATKPSCYKCDAQSCVDESCKEEECNGLCRVRNVFQKPENSPEDCYESLCIAHDPSIKNKVIIDANYHLNGEKTLDLWEIDVYCRTNNCSRLEIFKEIRENIKSTIMIDDTVFENHKPEISTVIIPTVTTPLVTETVTTPTSNSLTLRGTLTSLLLIFMIWAVTLY
ncbi:unnamed protein product, partial [Didymodactylos carnosus]